MTLYEVKEKMATLGAQVDADAEWIKKNAADPEVKMEEIKEKEAHRDDIQKRFDLLKAEHDKLEAEQQAKIKAKAKTAGGDVKKAFELAKGNLYKAMLVKEGVAEAKAEYAKAYEGLGGIPALDADLGYGSNLLPTTMSNELLVEPFQDNSLRRLEQVSNIPGLEEPQLIIDIEDASLEDVTDKETAKEIELAGNLITYGRHKTKVYVTIKDTVLHGSPYNLVATVENGLRSALAIKEKMRAFAESPDADNAHMSFYSTLNAIKVVPGSTQLDAILAAYGDLPDMFAEDASVVMRRTDYINMIRDLANGSEALFSKKPEEIIGIPVEFNDRATKPVVGNFNYARLNYDGVPILETDKDGRKGEYYFILTAWNDHQIKIKNAFRIAEVDTTTP